MGLEGSGQPQGDRPTACFVIAIVEGEGAKLKGETHDFEVSRVCGLYLLGGENPEAIIMFDRGNSPGTHLHGTVVNGSDRELPPIPPGSIHNSIFPRCRILTIEGKRNQTLTREGIHLEKSHLTLLQSRTNSDSPAGLGWPVVGKMGPQVCIKIRTIVADSSWTSFSICKISAWSESTVRPTGGDRLKKGRSFVELFIFLF